MPRICKATIGDIPEFKCDSATAIFQTPTSGTGKGQMGALSTVFQITVDFTDQKNLPFNSLQALFNLANVVTDSKIKAIKVDFPKDDNSGDVFCSYQFQGWITRLETTNHPGVAGASNGLLLISLQPVLDTTMFGTIQITN